MQVEGLEDEGRKTEEKYQRDTRAFQWGLYLWDYSLRVKIQQSGAPGPPCTKGRFKVGQAPRPRFEVRFHDLGKSFSFLELGCLLPSSLGLLGPLASYLIHRFKGLPPSQPSCSPAGHQQRNG